MNNIYIFFKIPNGHSEKMLPFTNRGYRLFDPSLTAGSSRSVNSQRKC